jgi:hypothetical protein
VSCTNSGRSLRALCLAAGCLLLLAPTGCVPARPPSLPAPEPASSIITSRTASVPALQIVDAAAVPGSDQLPAGSEIATGYPVLITGADISAVRMSQRPPDFGPPGENIALSLVFTSHGASKLAALSREQPGRTFLFVLSGKLINNPTGIGQFDGDRLTLQIPPDQTDRISAALVTTVPAP